MPQLRLRLNPITRTNDPREKKDLSFGISTSAPTAPVDVNRNLQLNKIVNTLIKEDCKVLCFSTDGRLEGYQLSQMWALYGGNHTGVCIALDYEKFMVENDIKPDSSYFKKVAYVTRKELEGKIVDQRYPSFRTDDHDDLVKFPTYIKEEFRVRYLDYLFFTKSIEWEHEQEIRLVHLPASESDEFCSIKESLRHIFLGIDFNVNDREPLIDLVRGSECKVWELAYSGEWLYCNSELTGSS